MTFDEFLDSVLIGDDHWELTVRKLVESYALEFGPDEAVILDKLKELWPTK